ncbi:hypothetical protein JE959_001604 [Aeromonas veronii]|nr:hypothetical protein [Aeromonas veronii]
MDLRLLDSHITEVVTAPLSKLRPLNIIASRREYPAIRIDCEAACADGILPLRLTMVKVRDLNAGNATGFNDQLAIGFAQHVLDENINFGHSEKSPMFFQHEGPPRHSDIAT